MSNRTLIPLLGGVEVRRPLTVMRLNRAMTSSCFDGATLPPNAGSAVATEARGDWRKLSSPAADNDSRPR